MRNDKDEKKPTRVTRRSGTRVGEASDGQRTEKGRGAPRRVDDYGFAYDDRAEREEGRERRNDPRDEREERRERRNDRAEERGEKREKRTERRDDRGESRAKKEERNRAGERKAPQEARAVQNAHRGGNADRTIHQLAPYMLFCLSIFAAVSFFLRDVIGVSDGAGAFGSFLADFLAGLFGLCSYLLPIFSFLLALRWRTYVKKEVLVKKLFLSLSFLFLLSGIVHVFQESGATRASVDVVASELYRGGIAHVGGGFFGGFIGEYLSFIFRLPGTILLAIPLLVIIGIYLIGMTPSDLWQRIVCKVKLLQEKREARRAELYDGEEKARPKSGKKSANEEKSTQVERAQEPLAVTEWREPRPLEKKQPPRKSYVFSDLEDDPIPVSRPVRPEKATPAPDPVIENLVDIPDDVPEVPVAPAAPAPIVPPVVESPQPAPTASAYTAPLHPQAFAAKEESEEQPHRESHVYAPFALPIQPFPKEEQAPAPEDALAVEQPAPAATVTEPVQKVPETRQATPFAATVSPFEPTSAPASAQSTPAKDADGEEVLGAFGAIGTVNLKPQQKPAPAYVPPRVENPAERYVHHELPFHHDPVPGPAPVTAQAADKELVIPVDTAPQEEALGGFAFEKAPEVEETPVIKDSPFTTPEPLCAEKEETLAFSAPVEVEEPEGETEGVIEESEDTQELSYRPAVARPANVFTFDREHSTSREEIRKDVPRETVTFEEESVPVYTKRVAPQEKPVPPRVPVSPAPVAPKAVPVKSAPVKAETPPPPPPPPREYVKPTLQLLNEDKNVRTQDFYEEIEETKDILRQTMSSFNIRIQDEINYSHGPSVTRYEMRPVAGTSVRSVTNRTEDIALNLASSVRIEAPIPGKPAIGIEVPNKVRETVYMRTMLESEQFKSSTDPLDVPLGLDVGGTVRMCNLAKMPHLLVAGTTGSGKSVCINSILVSLIYKTSPADLRLILIDPKQIEFAPYEHVPHLYMPIVTDMQRAAGALACAVQEMERRFSLIKDVGVRNIEAYNEAVKNDPEREHLPYIIIVIDEFADLKMSCNNNDPENFTCRIAQKARAAGMHLIIGTQRPSVDVITGKLKTNIPSRIAFMVKQQVDSRTILDVNGAEALTGRGDMLYMATTSNDKNPVRIQGAYVSDGELERVISYVKKHNDPVQYNQAFMDQIEMEMARNAKSDRKGDDFDYDDEEEGGEDPKFVEAVELAIQTQKVATSLLQRRLGVGYGRAAKIIDRMEELGLVSAPEGNKPRKLLPAAQGYLDHLAGAQGGAEEYGDDFA